MKGRKKVRDVVEFGEEVLSPWLSRGETDQDCREEKGEILPGMAPGSLAPWIAGPTQDVNQIVMDLATAVRQDLRC